MKGLDILLVGAGGFLGSIGRYIMTRTVDQKIAAVIPYGTLMVNILGSMLLGLIVASTLKKPDSETWRLLLGTGFCGGFTTFSAFAMENVVLLQQKQITDFALYTSISLLFCLLAAGAGIWIGNKVW